jgi:hypothetical protein
LYGLLYHDTYLKAMTKIGDGSNRGAALNALLLLWGDLWNCIWRRRHRVNGKSKALTAKEVFLKRWPQKQQEEVLVAPTTIQ